MRIRNFTHKGLRRLYLIDEAKAIPPGSADKLRNMLAYLDAMRSADELQKLPSWKPHLLTGARKGTWSLQVNRNWRLTFRVDPSEGEILDMNLEDYH